MAGFGRKVFTRERATSADVQGYLMDQAVMRFTSASARSAAIPSPSQGMHTYLDDVNRTDYWDGDSWEPVAPVFRANTTALVGAAAPAGTPVKVVAFSAVTTTNGSGDSIAVFPAAFPNGVQSVVASSGDFVAGGHAYATVQTVSLSQVILAHRQPSGASITNVTVRTNIIAVGW